MKDLRDLKDRPSALSSPPQLYRGASLIPRPTLQGYLAYKKTHPPRILPKAYAWGPRGVLGGWAFSYGRGTPVALQGHLVHTKAHARPTEGFQKRAPPYEVQGKLAHKKQHPPLGPP
jgi:hypothetical protein